MNNCKEFFKDFQLTVLALILGISLIIAVVAGTKNVSQKGIYMTGSAQTTVTSDSATWSITVNAKKATASEAYGNIKEQTDVILKYLKSEGLDEKSISIEPSTYWTSRRQLPNGQYTDEIVSYNYSQNIKVSSNDVEKIKKLSTDIQNLTEKNIDLVSYSPEYRYSGLATLKVSLLKEASLDAKKRADSALSVNGNKTGKILSVRTGVFQVTSPESADVSDSGINDSSTIEKKVTAVVNITYEIK